MSTPIPTTKLITTLQARIIALEVQLANAYRHAEEMGEVNLYIYNRREAKHLSSNPETNT